MNQSEKAPYAFNDLGREIDPEAWVLHVDDCVACRKHKVPDGATPWFDGRLKPCRVGWYERLFAGGVFRHFWDAYSWYENGDPHWAQVGDYPCWRGLIERGAPAC